MRESTIETNLKKAVKGVGGMCLKLPALHLSGAPDRLCLMPGGLAVFIELKAPKKKPRKLQLIIHKRLRALGFRVEIIDSNELIKNFINEFR